MQKISPFELQENPFELIHKKWAMITTRAGGKTNTMTASWGGVGAMWNKPAAFIFIRPQRFTRELIDNSELFSICFLPESYRKQLAYCGQKSGRDEDKLAVSGFETVDLDGAPIITQSDVVLTCKKLYCQQLTPESLVVPSIDTEYYPGKDYHYMYIAEILGAYTK